MRKLRRIWDIIEEPEGEVEVTVEEVPDPKVRRLDDNNNDQPPPSAGSMSR